MAHTKIIDRRDRGAPRRKDDALLRALFDNALDPILIADDDGRYVDVNPAACALLDYSRAELLRLSIWDLTPANHRDQAEARWREFDAAGQQSGERTLQRKDGTTVEVECRAVADFVPGLHLSILRDVTDLKRAKEALRLARERLAIAVDGAELGLYDANLQTGQAEVNEHYLRMLGFAPGETAVTVQSWLDSIHPDDRPRVLQIVEEHETAGRDRFEAEYRIRHRSGEWIWILDRGKGFDRDENGRPRRAAGTHTDITERKRVEERLRESEEHMCLAMGAAHMGTWEWNIESGEIFWSDNLWTMFGLESGTLPMTFDRFRDLIHPEDRDRLLQAIEDAIHSAAHYRLEVRFAKPDGSSRWALTNGQVLRDAAGVRRMVGVDMDITERKRVEERLRESEAILRTIFRAAPVGLGLTVDRVLREANQQVCRMLGYTCDELTGKSVRLLYPSQADFDFVGAEKYRQIRDRGVGTVETRWRGKDGAILDIMLSSAAIDPDDLAKGIAFSATDITERKRIEAELRQSEQRFRALVNLLPYGVQENDTEGRITFANPALERLHRSREGGVVGRFIWDFVADDADRERLRDHLRFLVREQPPPATYFSKNRRVDGSVIDVQVDWSYDRDQRGRVQGFIAIITDITERKRAETRLAENAERLQQLSRRLLSVQEEERRALARDLHDDFGQQLAALKLNLAMLERELPDPAHRSRLAACIQIVEHAGEAIQNIARQLRPAILDDLGLAEALHWYARNQTERTGCAIEVEERLPALLSPNLETAVFRIAQEAVNNAIRHGQARRIDIGVGVDQGKLTLVIEDDGAGFDPDARAAAGNRSSLGLIGMSERAALLGGRFALVGRPGAGVRIEVEIPLAEEGS